MKLRSRLTFTNSLFDALLGMRCTLMASLVTIFLTMKNFLLNVLAFILIPFYHSGLVYSIFVNIEEDSDSLLCRKCGHDIAVAASLNSVGSKLALRQRNDTILGVRECLIQLFKNPRGQHFEVITSSSANIRSYGEAVEEHSWFPGYAWRIGLCPQCGAHIGWSFEDLQKGSNKDKDEKGSHHHKHSHEEGTAEKDYSFVGLIYPNLIRKHYADSLIVTPKAYRS